MAKQYTEIATSGMSREDWLRYRRTGIGGSDAAGIVGLSKWSTPYTIWLDKTNRAVEKEETEPLRQGRDLEEYVAQRFSERTGKKVRRRNAIMRSTKYTWALANVDRMIVGEDAGLECKTTSTLDVRKFHDVEFPEQYYAQCLHYLAVTGADRWYLAVLVLGREFHVYTLQRDEEEIASLMRMEEHFWNMVLEDSAPSPSGNDADTEAITTIYRESREGTVELFGREPMLEEYERLRQQQNEISTRMAEIENEIKLDMQEAEKGEIGRFRVSWKTQTRRSFQVKEFTKEHPEISVDGYYKESTSRPFRITEAKEPA